MMKLTKNDTSVGVFLLLSLTAVGIFLIAKAGSQGWLAGTKRFRIVADDGHNIKEGAPVRMNGIDVGLVEQIDLSDTADVEVHFRVDPRFAPKLKIDGYATIVEPPILGLTYIDLEPFEFDADGRPIHPELPVAPGKGEIIIYRKPSSFMTTVQESLKRVESIMKKTDDALEKANLTLASVATITASIADGDGFAARLIKDQQLANDLKTTISKVALMADDLTSVTVSLRNREGALGHLLASDELIVQSEKLLAKARESLASLDEVTKRLTGSVELVANRLDQAGASVEGVKQVLDNTKEITAQLATLTSNLNAGKGTVGKFLSDDAVYVEARGLLKELRETVQDLREQAPINSFIGVVFSAF